MWHRVVTIPQACDASYTNGVRARARECTDAVMVVGERTGTKKKREHAEVGVKREGVLHEIFVVACAVA